MSREPPHLNTDPCPAWTRSHYSPCQDPLPGPEICRPEIVWGKPTNMDHLHLWSCWRRALPENTRLGLLGFLVLLLGALQFLMRHWGRGALMLAFLSLLVAAPYYAQNLRLHHRPARFVRTLFFVTFTWPGDRNPPRQTLRIFPLMFISFSSVLLLFWP